MPAPANLVHETSSSTGTGNLTVAAVNGKQRLSTAFSTGATTDVFDYFISNRDAAEYERGTGHMSDANTLVRDTVIESTNANAAVNFSAGVKDIMNDVPAAKQAALDLARTFSAQQTFSAAINLTSGQIVFPATQAASAGANTLDDYEEGTWTPVLRFGAATTGITYTAQAGQYTKIGRYVIAFFQFTLSSNGSATGRASLAGLPFTPVTSGGGAIVSGSGWSGISGACSCLAYTDAIIYLEMLGATGQTDFAETNFTDTAMMTGYTVYDV